MNRTRGETMYRVMIIDDEISVRKLLKGMIPWSKFNMEVVGEAASGIEAINTIDDLRPDVCFVDIRMPFMNGMEFSKLAIERYPQMKIIILTAYEEFEYARECVGIGVADYQVKPIVEAEIIASLTRIQHILDERTPEGEIVKEESSSSTERVIQYLEEYYQLPDLNLTKVAMELGFNRSYLSRRFKQDTGSNFIDYLFQLRMNEAKRLAQSDKALYQIATIVGVPDPNYFGKCFKKYVGVTFSVYKQNLGLL